MKISLPTGLLVLILVAMTVGCGWDSESMVLSSLDPAAHTHEASDLEAEEPHAVSLAHWTPPYPHRNNPFRFPGEADRVEPKQTESLSSANVSLVGFAQLDKRLAILKIQESTQMMAVGDSFAGIRVVEISPPVVTLQTSNLIWSIKLFDSPSSASNNHR